MSNNLDNFDKDYGGLIPDIDGFGLDLTWDHEFVCCNKDHFATNFGVIAMYEIGSTGHDFLVLCPMPNMKVEEYPIAIYNEEQSEIEVIASSIKRWLPVYLVHDLVEGHGSLFDTLEHKDDFLKILKRFENKKIYDWMNKTLSNLNWDDIENTYPGKEEARNYYKYVEPNSYISEFLELKEKNPELHIWKEFVFKYPFFNKGLYQMYKLPDDDIIFEDDAVEKIDVETAYEVFHRRFTHDMKQITDFIKVSAMVVSKDTSYKGKPFWDLIKGTADGSINFWGSWETFLAEGKQFEKKNQLINAQICYENALYLADSEIGFYSDALDAMKSVAKKINDPNYLKYLKKFEDGTASFFK
ncbi:MAG: hypothetical protein ACFFCM_05630 [Promethearchaeota archaeon]